jgi:anti-sigma-K factor RskA
MEEDFQDLLPFYALGALYPEEQMRLEAALERDRALRQELLTWVAAAESLPLAAAPAAPASAVKAGLLRRVRGEAAPGGRPAARRRLRLTAAADRLRSHALAAAGLLLAGLAVGLAALTRGELAAVRAHNAALQQELLRQQQLLVAMADPGLQPLAVAGTQAQPGARGRLFADPQGHGGVLLVSGLAPVGPEQAYQVWLIRADQPTSVGLLIVSATGEGTLVVQAPEPFSAYGALGVSLEPAGGSPLPTGPIVLLQDLRY